MEELLKEVTLSERRRKTIDSLVQEVTSLLASVPETTDTELSDQSWMPRGVKVPLLQVPYSVKGRFRMAPPHSVKLVGSYPLGTCSKPDVNVDLAVTMPAILHPKDYLNQRYHRKRALYLTGLAHHLSSSHAFGSLRFTYHHGNHLRPLLLLTPQGKEERSVTLRLHVCPPAGFFKPSRFHPRKNNVRTAWFLDQETPQQDISEPPTPHYNNSVLSDMLLESHKSFLSASAADFPGFREGVAVIKVWLRQRELHQGYGCFSGFLASMLVAYLLSKHKINSMMSAYQVLRNVLQFLATTDLTESGITLAKGTDSTVPALSEFHDAFQVVFVDPSGHVNLCGDMTASKYRQPALSEFHDAFQVVFVDPSGHVNLCGDMTASKYRQVQHEARLSMQVWDNPKLDGFHALLMTPKPLVRTFDHIFHLPAVVKLQAACKKMELLSELMDHAGNYVAAALPFIMSLLQRGLGDRVRLLAHSLPQSPEWTIDSEPPKQKDKGLLSFGLLLNPEFSTNTLERGPPADSAQALEFRKLWGERAELRRFQDGSICEAVVWQGGSAFQKRLIPEQIIKHLLQLHANIPESSVCYMGALLDEVIKVGREVGFLRFLHLLVSFDWRNDPLIVNLNGDITATEITEIRNDFIASRSSLPAMFIATPKDKKNSVWTKEGPSVQDVLFVDVIFNQISMVSRCVVLISVLGALSFQILQRLIVLAAESLRVLETQLTDPTQPQDVKMVLRPPLDIYDVLIHLNPKQVPLHAQAVDTPRTVFSRGALPSGAAGGSGNMPVVDFNPVACYLSELRTAHVKARLVQVKGSEAQTVPNVEAILEDFETLGAGLVREVEVRSERWTV
ncbi:UNVERIFIED_CONTAM: hypothetical protein FKN15_040823 [Acipenser sinensis]